MYDRVKLGGFHGMAGQVELSHEMKNIPASFHLASPKQSLEECG